MVLTSTDGADGGMTLRLKRQCYVQTCRRLRSLIAACGVHELCVCRPESSPEVQRSVVSFVASTVRLSSLSLELTDLTPQAASMLSGATADLTQLTALTMDGNRLCLAVVGALAVGLRQLSALQHFSIADAHVCPAGAEVIAAALGALTTLQSLVLNSTRLGAAGAAALSASIRSLAQLTRLELDSALAAVSSGVYECMASLRAARQLRLLRVGGNKLCAEGVEALAVSLSGLHALTHLDACAWWRLGSSHWAAAFASLPAMSALESLQLDHNPLNDAEASTLADALRSCSRLTAVSLSGCQLTAAGARALQPALCQLSGLQSLALLQEEHLRIGFVVIGEELPFARATLQALLSDSALARLTALQLGVYAAEMQSAAPHFAALGSLVALELVLTGSVGDPAVRALTAIVVELPQLCDLRVHGMLDVSCHMRPLETLIVAVALLTRLTTLHLLERGGPYTNFRLMLLRAFACLTRLDSFAHGAHFDMRGRDTAAGLAGTLRRLPALRSLSVSCGHPHKMARVAAALPAAPALTQLEMERADIFVNIPGAAQQLTALRSLRNLRMTGLDDTSEVDVSAPTLLQAVQQLTKLTLLTLGSEDGVKGSIVAGGLAGLAHLQHLSVVVWFGDHADAVSLTQLICSLTRLSSLDLACSGDGFPNAEQLADCFKSLRRLQTLKVNWRARCFLAPNAPWIRDAMVIWHALCRLPELVRVMVWDKRHEDELDDLLTTEIETGVVDYERLDARYEGRGLDWSGVLKLREVLSHRGGALYICH